MIRRIVRPRGWGLRIDWICVVVHLGFNHPFDLCDEIVLLVQPAVGDECERTDKK